MIGVVQLRSEAFAAEANRARMVERIAEAATRGASVVVCPELAVPGYVLDRTGLEGAAEPLHGPTLAALHRVAAEHGIVAAAGFCEREGDALFNSAMLVGPEGLLLHYRKLHLFDREKLIFTPGDTPLGVADTRFGRIGLCVCYDLRFIEVLRGLALQGAALAAVPTAWVAGFDKTPRDREGLIGQVRGATLQANLNQIYVACASQAGVVRDTAFLGSSMVADPFGTVLAGPLGDSAEEIAMAPFDPAVALQAQHRSLLIQPRADRRTDIYGLRIGDRVY